MGSIRYQYLRPVDFFLSPVSPVSSQPPDLFPGNAFHLQKRLFNGMPVIFVPKGLDAVLRMVAEALVPVNPLEDESVALAQRETQGFHGGQHFADNLFMQLRVRGQVSFFSCTVESMKAVS